MFIENAWPYEQIVLKLASKSRYAMVRFACLFHKEMFYV